MVVAWPWLCHTARMRVLFSHVTRRSWPRTSARLFASLFSMSSHKIMDLCAYYTANPNSKVPSTSCVLCIHTHTHTHTRARAHKHTLEHPIYPRRCQVWVGTRFVCAKEAGAPPIHQKSVITAGRYFDACDGIVALSVSVVCACVCVCVCSCVHVRDVNHGFVCNYLLLCPVS